MQELLCWSWRDVKAEVIVTTDKVTKQMPPAQAQRSHSVELTGEPTVIFNESRLHEPDAFVVVVEIAARQRAVVAVGYAQGRSYARGGYSGQPQRCRGE